MAEYNNVLITGFGPFGDHTINASWEAVSGLPDIINDFNIIKQQVPVVYKLVEEKVPLLWEEYKPKLVIHVGVSSCTSVIQLETKANKTGYIRADIYKCCPKNSKACCAITNENDDCINTNLSTRIICDRVNQIPELKATISNDAGRYLCEFIYYVSLNHDNKRALFVHVPPLNKPFTKEQLTRALEEIIKCALELIKEEELKIASFPADATRIYKNGRAAAAF